MPRIVISLVISLVLIGGALFVKHETSAAHNPKAVLIATEINTLNAPAIAEYAQELEASSTSATSSYPTVTDTSSAPAVPLNATQALSQNLFTQYMSLKESGVDVSGDVAQQLASNLLSQTYVTGTSTTYAEKNLTINANPSKQDLINYGNALGAILSTPLPNGAQTEIDIFQTFAQTNDTSILPKLSENISRYEDMEKMLLNTKVPYAFAQDHLGIMNTISKIIHDIEVVQTSDTDPVGAESALADYQNEVTNLTNSLADEKTLFDQNNVVFSTQDSGYLLTK